MSDYATQHCSTLEIFPDELFFELFEYIPLNDLYRAFFGLNQRINMILKNLPNLFAEWTTYTDDKIIDIFSSCINRLVIWRGGYLNLNRFIKLRSLKLALPTIEQCNEIQSSLILEHLHIESSVNSRTITEQLSILFLSNAFPRLRTCRIDEIQFDKDIFHSKLTLHSLITRTQYPSRLLSLCPMLKYLRLNLKDNINEYYSFDIHLNLRHLHIGIYSIEINLSTIETILSLTPNIIHFTLDGPCITPPQNKLDICSIASVLTRRLSKLRSIYLGLPLNDNQSDPKEFENEKELLKKLHPLFNYIIFRPRSYYAPGRLLISSIIDSKTVKSYIN
ncbi:unnamed protein product [Rotaria sp. Silwood1]|nr:unnamed protein product [Rotaria sp. Silwood1]CAF1545138.1 unnamed protein product [Rotaria sp. Silwood1]CAF3643878.1 unnamed protein product [Rotaria sp. Silwood1]CAF3697224.1 unnamed protein product [Rotaria sp. Silwood1]CAF4645749.1 unnamed protein product [Rotaria sp. Silwood1]